MALSSQVACREHCALQVWLDDNGPLPGVPYDVRCRICGFGLKGSHEGVIRVLQDEKTPIGFAPRRAVV